MARDLYGEMLGRALSRRAPPGHIPAYITPSEAQQLRARGGGVTPGGGQVMVGGLPAFPPPGAHAYAMGGGRVPTTMAAPGVFVTPAQAQGRRSAQSQVMPQARTPPVSPYYSTAPVIAPAQAATAPVIAPPEIVKSRILEDSLDIVPDPARARAYFTAAQEALDRQADIIDWTDPKVPPYEVDRTKSNLENQGLNLEAAVNNSKYYNPVAQRWTDAGVELVSKNISEGGLGRFSPGATLLSNNREAPATVVAHVMQQSPRPGQGAAIFDPRGNVSVPPGYNMGWGPAVLGTAIGALAPGVAGLAINAGMMASGYPTLGRMLGDYLVDEEVPVLGGLVEGKRALGAALSNALFGEDEVRVADAPSAEAVRIPVAPWAPDERRPETFSFTPPPPPLAPATEAGATDGEDAEAAEAEEPFVTEVSPDLLARLEENAALGLLRLGQAGQA